MDFAELHCTPAFTFLTGASQPEELVLQAWRQGYRALAITDDGSLAGVVRAYQARKNLKQALKDEGRTLDFRLIVGSHFRLHQDRGELRLVLLARDRQAYGEISTLITRGRRRAESRAGSRNSSHPSPNDCSGRSGASCSYFSNPNPQPDEVLVSMRRTYGDPCGFSHALCIAVTGACVHMAWGQT